MSDRALHDVVVLVVRLDSDRPRPAVLEALLQQVECGVLRLVDFLIVRRNRQPGSFDYVEIDEQTFGLAGLRPGVPGLVSREDAMTLCADLPVNGTAALILVEPTWLERFSSELRRHGADVLSAQPITASHANSVWLTAATTEAP
ncbi:DUF6325 family protein [Microbacterium sp. 3J1]|uniref:DUF6325 family protein n=1 Tax=Microbacterium sp. 3J1 TaxID=861269 RepID=UPI000ACAB28E|nr:DUF6325 family protein [Microbacterium sp. 3J1]